MADILIRGMEIPRSCLDCPMMVDRYDTDACALQSEEANEEFESWEDMQRNCPLVPLPEGHGRLGDLDSLQEEFKKSHDGKRLMLIDTAPTIVPAEGGKNE